MSGAADGAIQRAAAILDRVCGDRLYRGLSLAPLTTFRIGGPAALFLEPETDADLLAAGEAVARTDIPFAVIGKGSDLLVSDRGFAGLVLRLGRGFRWASRDGDSLAAGGAMPLPALSGVGLRHGLSGLEFGVAIPATLGGAIWMNAGAHGRSMADVLEVVRVFRLREGRFEPVSASEAGFGYRHSELGSGAIVVGATMRLAAGDRQEIRAGMDEARDRRRATQPLAEPNCGSVFTNPPGDFAARLIEEAGGKGMSVGAAKVSEKHANFIVAGQGATAADVLALIRRVGALVEANSGVHLEPEVRLIGEFDEG